MSRAKQKKRLLKLRVEADLPCIFSRSALLFKRKPKFKESLHVAICKRSIVRIRLVIEIIIVIEIVKVFAAFLASQGISTEKLPTTGTVWKHLEG